MIAFEEARTKAEAVEGADRALLTLYSLSPVMPDYSFVRMAFGLPGWRGRLDGMNWSGVVARCAKANGFTGPHILEPTERHALLCTAPPQLLDMLEREVRRCCMAADEPKLVLGFYTGAAVHEMRGPRFEFDSLPRRRMYDACDLGEGWFLSRPPEVRALLLHDQLRLLLHDGSSDCFCGRLMKLCGEGAGGAGAVPENLPDIALHSLLSGSLGAWRWHAAHLPQTPACDVTRGIAELLFGRADSAERLLLSVRRRMRAAHEGGSPVLDGTFEAALQLARLAQGDAKSLAAIEKDMEKRFSGLSCEPGFEGAAAVCCLARLRLGEDPARLAEAVGELARTERAGILPRILCITAAERILGPGSVPEAPTWFRWLSANLSLAAMLLMPVLGLGTPRDAEGVLLDLSGLVPERNAWEVRLERLESFLGSPDGGPRPDAGQRLAWLFDPDAMLLEPCVQTRSRTGKWSAGKKLPLRRLRDEAASAAWFTDRDRRAASCVRSNRWPPQSASLDVPRALTFLTGHPLLFHAVTRERIELEEGVLQLSLEESAQSCRLSLPDFDDDAPCVLERRDATHFTCSPVTAEMRQVRKLVGTGLSFPRTEMGRVLAMFGRSPKIPLRADVRAEEREGSAVPVVQLRQTGSSFEADVRVRPAGEGGQAVVPGHAPEYLFASAGGGTLKVRRNFDAEERNAAALLAACPSLAERCDGFHAGLEDAQAALEVLDEIRRCPVPHAVEWPEGEKLRIAGGASSQDVRITVRTRGDWFELSGGVAVDERLVAGMQMLLRAAEDEGSRFVRLDDTSFLALTEELKHRLARLAAAAPSGGGAVKLHPLAAAAVREDLEAMDVSSDAEWRRLMKKLRDAAELTPVVSPKLQADLRPYQRDGVEWMLHLAAMGCGACLADDMGLGKTVQAIAVMLDLASEGPCLVVAPTSVCPNWEQEIAKFAPPLEALRPGASGSRTELIAGAGPGQVLVISYSLLHIEHEALAARHWAMVVFDEAQALKNAHTKRARAGGDLDAGFRLALTGTPIENHVEDIWSLFNAILPGLLGSQEGFRRRFSGAKPGSSGARALKRLIRPFLLRRLKSHVIDDLPGRTEQTLLIEPSAKEKAFYEALRRRVKEGISQLDGQAPGSRRIHILAGLTKLRRACCHPSLAEGAAGIAESPGAAGPGSKIERLLELASELRQGGHRMLVFSQFTGHLALIRQALDATDLTYLYLDGSTPEKKRAEAVAAFQKGRADIFLISLRAGGHGINLTAADYVVHMDPWWNPAVEDQASDRACRIGQKRPVTIYRLVMAGSVEEKILEMHKEKKELAADFLEGSDSAAFRLAEEDLLALMD